MNSRANRLLFVATVLASISPLACSSVSWSVNREVCGQIQATDKGSSTILRNIDLQLYRSQTKHIPCCSKADRISDMRTDANGDFMSGSLQPGRYFIVVKDSDPKFVFPISLEKQYDGKTCSLHAVFSFDRQTKKTEQTVTLEVPKLK